MSEEQPLTVQSAPAVRERLLAEALRLFTAKGYSATTVREIVEAAGVSKPVLYYYFSNKEGLYLALMESSYAMYASRMASLMATTGTVRERMEMLCLGIFDCFVETLDLVRLIYAIYFGPPQGAPSFKHEQACDWMLDAIGTLVREGIACGEFRNREPLEAIWSIFGVLNTCMEEQLCRETPRVDRAATARIINLVLDGLA